MVVNVKLKFFQEYSETLKDDLEAFKSLLPRYVGVGLQDTMEQMVSAIQDEIKNSFYESYEPKLYKRRSLHPELGTPLEADENFKVVVDSRRMSARIDYYPDTNNIYDEQMGRAQYDDPDTMLAAVFYNGEMGMPPLLWWKDSGKRYDVRHRNFLDPVMFEWLKYGKADKVFAESMNKSELASEDVRFEYDGNVDSESGDFFFAQYKGERGYTHPDTFARYAQDMRKSNPPKQGNSRTKKK